MNRRRYVALVGVSLLPGCNATSSSADDGAPAPTAVPATETPEPATPEATPEATEPDAGSGSGPSTPNTAFAGNVIREAVDELNLAINDLHFSTRDIEHPDQVPDIETREPELSTEFISDLLDEATPDASAEQREQIDALRTFNGLILDAIAVVETTFEIHDGWEVGISFYRSERLETAASELEEQIAPIEESREQVAGMQDTLVDVEAELGEETAVKVDDFHDFLDDLTAILNGFGVLMNGAIILVEGQREMDLGLEAIRNDDPKDDDYHEGEDRFTAAIDLLAEAEATFKTGERRDDITFQNEIIASTCEADRLKTASEHYREASNLAIRSRFEEAIDAMAAGDDELNRGC